MAVGSSVTLFGSDGSEWNLTTGAQGALLMSGVKGFHLPRFDTFADEAGGVAGSTYRGSRTLAREEMLNVFIDGAVGAAWYALDARWWAAWAGPSVLRISSGSTVRYLMVRLANAPDTTFDTDPAVHGQQLYSLPVVAHRPFYYGDPIVAAASYTSAAVGNFYGGTSTYGNPFSRPTSDDFSAMKLPNPGDLSVWVEWTVTGPCDGFTVGTAAGAVVYGPRLDAGITVTIVSDPADPRGRRVVNDAGVSLYGGLLAQNFAPIPPGGAPLMVNPINSGVGCRVTARIVPLWRLPW